MVKKMNIFCYCKCKERMGERAGINKWLLPTWRKEREGSKVFSSQKVIARPWTLHHPLPFWVKAKVFILGSPPPPFWLCQQGRREIPSQSLSPHVLVSVLSHPSQVHASTRRRWAQLNGTSSLCSLSPASLSSWLHHALLLSWFLMTHNRRETILRYSLLLESTREWKKKGGGEIWTGGEGRGVWCQLPFWIIIVGNDLQIFNVVCVTSGWFVPYSDLSKLARLEACASLCFRLFLESQARSCSDQADDDLLALLCAPAHKPKGFLVSRGKIPCMGSCS